MRSPFPPPPFMFLLKSKFSKSSPGFHLSRSFFLLVVICCHRLAAGPTKAFALRILFYSVSALSWLRLRRCPLDTRAAENLSALLRRRAL